MHKDRFGNVWVTDEEADKLYKASRALLDALNELDGADLLEGEGKPFDALWKAVTATRKAIRPIEAR